MAKDPKSPHDAGDGPISWNPAGNPIEFSSDDGPVQDRANDLADDARELADLIADINTAKDDGTDFDHDQPHEWRGDRS